MSGIESIPEHDCDLTRLTMLVLLDVVWELHKGVA